MKKILVILVAVIGFGFSTIAQTRLWNGYYESKDSNGNVKITDANGKHIYLGFAIRKVELLRNGWWKTIDQDGRLGLRKPDGSSGFYLGLGPRKIDLLSDGNFRIVLQDGSVYIKNTEGVTISRGRE
ncbi:MAG: hypothetical protein LBK94_03045 [Prevotellaceae bacterium]|jgi:hypothetical protein|nr:hypothetical protein [Prevotellaceae bacterium]